MKLLSYFATDIGLVRSINQDSLLVDLQNRFFIIADGMGGHQGGEIASELAVKTMSQELKNKTQITTSLTQHLQDACLQSNKTIYNQGQKHAHLVGMGTTLCALWVRQDGQGYIANIGDSRLYLERDNKLWLLTEDHNFITEYRKTCFPSREESTFVPSIKDNILTRSVGYFASVEADIIEKKLEKGDKYLICSDGLCGFVPDPEIHTILKNFKLKDVPKECIKKALTKGGEDNISVIVVEVQ